MIYSTGKMLVDNGDKLDENTKKEVEKAVADAKDIKDSDDFDEITAKKEALSKVTIKIGQAIYSQQAKVGEGSKEEKKDTTS